MSRPGDPLEWAPGPAKFNSPTRTSGKAIASLVLGILSFCFSLFAAIPAIILGALALNEINREEGRVTGKGLALAGIITGALGILIIPALMIPGVQAAREAARRTQCTNNLKQIGLALYNYESAVGSLPPAYVADENGRPRASWRVMILPYMEQISVYNAYNFDVAWDHPSNTTAINSRITTYLCPSESAEPGEELFTNYLMVTGPGTVFDPQRAAITRLSDIKDGTSNTVGVVQSSRKVHWASPDDLVVDAKNPSQPLPLDQLKNPHPGGFQGLFLDGSVRFLKSSLDPVTLRSLFTIAGGEVVSLDD
jgi:prepilin-type processing-associated H-X9-DG protein